MFNNSWFKKEKPLLGLLGSGGGVAAGGGAEAAWPKTVNLKVWGAGGGQSGRPTNPNSNTYGGGGSYGSLTFEVDAPGITFYIYLGQGRVTGDPGGQCFNTGGSGPGPGEPGGSGGSGGSGSSY